MLRILFLNRRDIKNPAGGGAERYTHEIARGLVKKYGCKIVHLSCRFKDSQKEEEIEGIKYIRCGNELTVHVFGLLYAFKNQKAFDLIIDQFNGSGFYTFFMPKSILLIHQIYKEFWLRELGPAGIIPYIFEPIILWFYRNKPAITVSRSTEEDLKKLGFKDVYIIANALSRPHLSSREKEKLPTITFLGRLRSTKRPEDAIEVFKIVKDRIPEARLWIIGRGPEEKRLRGLAKDIDDVVFHGWVDEKKKMDLLRQSHVLMVPSVREGFGINVIEAASQGTPAISYNVPGLRDSILHARTGYLVNNRQEAASAIINLILDKKLYAEISHNCLNYAKDFDWDKRVDEFWQKIYMINPD